MKKNNFYELNILGLKRQLPILKTPSGINIAGFNLVGDMELLKKAGKFLSYQTITKDIKYDIILTTELKGLPIAQEVARYLNCDYVYLRKSKKCYMLNPISIAGESITSGKSEYYVSQTEYEKLKNKNVLFVDDVYSTGSTFKFMKNFSKQAGFKITGCLSVLKEGKKNDDNLNFNAEDTPVICCGFLPLPEISQEKGEKEWSMN